MPIMSSCDDVEAYVTKDGSIIRELMHPQVHGNSSQSLAEARVAPGSSTLLHRHNVTEEIYHILGGMGLLTLGDGLIEVKAGDSVCISPGTLHSIKNTGENELRILCCCSPAYSHDDTELAE
ncbi:cupin domain-containing protein [Methanolobus vulcani]|uniref:Cupin domain-containing protein n=1 Tax=Methanolobus vulcani TaxID=38026 RepID=A0A7Z8P1F7_9EURY|nr:cupin domain-containing protein [Methanolobus vulcani]TQD23588.1 cupin domain-containing protein [Methanolobus vulcani]